MIEIIKEVVDMPPPKERRYQLTKYSRLWMVMDVAKNIVRYWGGYENAHLVCFNLNKKYYRDLNKQKSEARQ